VWWVSIPLYIMEVHAAVGLGLFTFSLWDVDRRPQAREVLRTRSRVAVLIPTYNEDLEVLMPTIAAALEMRVKHETWVLDDGNRPDVAQLARELGARYLARPTNEHAKAGNLNHALGIIEADIIAVLDADHVASPDFLTHTLGYFDDPKVALVQTPQEFYNLESFEHERGGVTKVEPLDAPTSALFHEQVLFYRILQPGKNRWGGAFWCGTGAVVRVAALRDVGGVATDTITEDIHTTIRLHRKGWQTVYHNEVLARGLAASDAGTYQLQRHRWGTGAMQVLRRENPLLVSGLTLPQRLTYAATLLGWFDSWRSLGYLLLPLVVIATGAVPIAADALTFMVFFGTTFLLGQLSLRVLSRGCHRPILSILFEFVRMTPNFMATMTLFTNRRAAFRVTPKGRTGGRNGAHVSPILTAMLVLSLVAVGWYGATLLGFTPVVYAIPWAVHAAFAWMVVNVGLVWLAIHRVRASRYAVERRSSVRFATDFHGRIDGIEASVRDLSLTGARLEVPDASVVAPSGRLVVETGGGRPIVLDGVARTTWTDRAGRTMVGFEFVEGQYPARARLALALFGARTTEARRLTAARRAVVKAQDRADALEDLVAASSAA
jgi:cellulose synthase (UDP-forming)